MTGPHATPPAAPRAAPLRAEIAAMIAQDGPMAVERYMSLCLAHPTLGYYITRDPLGAAGDFITAPEISQMFGEMIGLWAAEMARATGARRLVELGPGRGALMADALRALRVAPDVYDALTIDLVETSPALIAKQRAALGAVDRPVRWRAGLDAVEPAAAITLANEFFDALPIRQYVRAGGAWRERHVGLDASGALTFGAAPHAEPAIEIDGPDGAILETAPAARRIVTAIAARIVRFGGAALIIDYGYDRTAIGETLQALHAHRPVDPLAAPGQDDLTAHVDFAGLARAARATGATTYGPTPQGVFLRRLGLDQRAALLSRAATPAQQAMIAAARDRLSAMARPTDMGALFKVMAITRRGVPPPPGFEDSGPP